MVELKDLKIEIFADGADLAEMKESNKLPYIKGFTTNPFFLRSSGVEDYKQFALDVVEAIPDKPLSFEVISDDFESMKKEAIEISKWGEHVFVKIPITNTQAESTADLVKDLSAMGIKLNVTVIYTEAQIELMAEALSPETDSIISVFAGRIGETGNDPVPIVKKAVERVKAKNLTRTKVLWASTREVFNIIEADRIGCQIITASNDILKKVNTIGRSLEEVSLETVKIFYNDAQLSGYKI